ncbi:signal peptidase II [Ruania halotolerans]|uniref:signal peptidase II n=1 Tax=Ruania halotolerans TaxID=2897773 RepID=UPI001E5D0C35|nr:signal peptidase II [Ruania halotolerans]UFU05113.1 signal peptidase II [Ruania halotolerans]
MAGAHEKSDRDPVGTGAGVRGRRRRLLRVVVLLTLGVLAADQITKFAVLAQFDAGEYHPVIGDLLGLSLVFNPGAAFSFAEGATWLFTIAAVVVAVVILRISRRLGSLAWAIALGALLGGNLGNLGDRLFREPGFGVGHVVDFINYGGYFVGNIADIAIVLSAVAIAVLSFRGVALDGTRAGGGGEPVADEREPAGDESDSASTTFAEDDEHAGHVDASASGDLSEETRGTRDRSDG